MFSFAAQRARASVAVIGMLLTTLTLLHGVAQGAVFKCVSNGEVTYQSTPCASGAAPYKETSQPQQATPPGVIMVMPAAAAGAPLGAAMPAPMAGGRSGAIGAAMPAPIVGGALQGARPEVARSRSPALTGMAAYADGRNDLTPEQVKIGYAFSMGDRATVLALIKTAHDSLDFAIFRDSNTTPLLFAARSADNDMIAAVLAKGIPVDSTKTTQWRSGETALIAAVDGTFAGHFGQAPIPPERYLETARFLLKAGASPNARRSDGNTPLNTALRLKPPAAQGENAKIAMVKLLLESGAKPDTELPSNDLTNDADTAIVNLLLAHGFDPRANGSTALASAVQTRRLALVQLLLAKGADPNAHALTGSHKVLVDADLPTAKLLLAAGANPNVCDNEDSSGKCLSYASPLIFKVVYDPEYFRLMIAKGANLNVQNAQGGETLLAQVIRYRSMREQGITKVCMAGTSNCQDIPQDTFDRVKTARMLLDAGANPNQLSNNELPLLMVDDNDHAMIGLLLDKGGRPATLAVEGEKIGPISQVIVGHDYLPREMLRRTPGKLGDEEKWALFATLIDNRLDLAEELVRHGLNPNARGPLGETAMHYAVMSQGGADAVRRMMALGANLNAQTDAIPDAVLSNPGGPPVPQMQAKQKIYAAARVGSGSGFDGRMTPLMLAVVSMRPQVVQALLEGGAKASIKSQRGWTALDYANRMGNQQIAQMLQGRS